MNAEKTGKPTLTEIARIVGVSQPLVSNILNGKGRSSPEVKEKVLSLLDQAGYRPLIARRPFFHVVFVGSDGRSHDENTIPVQFGLQEIFLQEGLAVQQQYLSKSRDLPLIKQADLLIGQKPPGIIIDTEKKFTRPVLDCFHKAGIPLVQIGQYCDDARFPSVTADCLGGIRTAVNELIRRGHRRIALLRWLPDGGFENSEEKLSGYKLALSDNGLPFDPALVAEITCQPPITERWTEGARFHLRKLHEQTDPPAAVVIDNSYIAASVILPLGEDCGVLPGWLEQMDVALYSDMNTYGQSLQLSRQLCLPMKSVFLISPDWVEVGRLAARELISEVRGNRGGRAARSLKVQPTLGVPEIRFA